jgi:biopolymer transport protein ExbD
MFDEIEHEEKIDINLTPTINIVFLLLIFFLVQGSLSNSDVLPIDAPFSKNGTTVFSDPIEILVNKYDLIINLEIVTDQGLRDILSQILAVDSTTEIMLKADAELDAIRLVEVLKNVQDSGAKNIFLITAAPY